MNSQEALDLLMFYPRIIENKGSVRVVDLQEAYSTLQELINNYNKMSNEFDMLLDTNEQFERENIKLEKALDKACFALAEINIDFSDCGYCDLLYYEDGKACEYCKKGTQESWKEYALKEVPNDKTNS